MSSLQHRDSLVIAGNTEPKHQSVRTALDILRENPSQLLEIRDRIASGLSRGLDDVDISRARRLLYATDASIYEMEPIAITYPQNTEDVQAIVQVANELGVPILPRGAGTSLAGQGVNHAIVIDFTRHMNKIIKIAPEEQIAVVQPGLVVDHLNKEAKQFQLMYPVDPSTRNRATIGGGIGNNSCGAHSLRHGKTSDQVISLTVVLNDGSIVRTSPLSGPQLEEKLNGSNREGDLYRTVTEIVRTRQQEIEAYFPDIPRRVSGYNFDTVLSADDIKGETVDLGQLLVGSEGTLGLVTEATIGLVTSAEKTGIVALHFETIEAACRAAPQAVAHDPAAVEFVDHTIIERCRDSLSYASLVDFVIGDPGGLLLVEVDGDTDEIVQSKMQALRDDFAERGLTDQAFSTANVGEQARIWRMREAGLGILMSVKGDTKPVAFVEDGAVQPDRLGDYVARFEEIVSRYDLPTAYYGHAGAGCLHIRPMINLKEAGGPQQAENVATEIADLILEFGGSLSGEHGDGIVRGVFAERMFGPALVDSFRELKLTFDPDSIFNPGKIFDTPPFDDNLRLSPETSSLTPPTTLDWTEWGGLVGAAEQCNGQGACLKDTGSMCPSFMVTKDEEHSTRGRANLLRQVLNRTLPPEELSGDRLYEALELCVECKACKSECPSAVDMALMKSEVLSIRHSIRGVPFRDRVFGNIAAGAKLTHFLKLHTLTNKIGSLSLTKRLLQKTLGIHAERALPQFSPHTFSDWYNSRTSGKPASEGEVVLFIDTFTNYFQPEVGIAAVDVLEALGYGVHIAHKTECCGRPMISKGMLSEAKQTAKNNLLSLEKHLRDGLPVLGIEPSCLLAFRDEYPLLLNEDSSMTELTQLGAENSFLIEEFISELIENNPEKVAAAFSGGPDVSIHVHCHEKALVGTEMAMEVLSVSGIKANLIDSACCGMAGSFGFEKEHYDISKSMAYRTLVPAVSEMAEDQQLLVTGTSCREQLTHFSERDPIHLIQALAGALADK